MILSERLYEEFMLVHKAVEIEINEEKEVWDAIYKSHELFNT
jgi:hypothetical protein